MRDVRYQYAISSFDRRFVTKGVNGFGVMTKDEFDNAESFFDSVLIFCSANDAEDFIWRNNLLNLDVTFRPELL